MDERKGLRLWRRIVAIGALAAGSAQAAPLVLDLSADASFDRAWAWSIEKQVTPQFSDRFVGETQELQWTITATRGAAVDSGFLVEGSFGIDNPNTEAVDVSSISLTFDSAVVAHDCATGTLAAGGSLECNFSFSTTDAAGGELALSVEGSGDADAATTFDVAFGDPAVTNGSITVDDDFLAEPLVFSDTGEETYTTDATCADGNSVHVENTATIVGTGQSDTVEARVSCHVLRQNRQASVGSGTTWTWDIDKSHAEVEPLMIGAGESVDVDYTIELTATAQEGGGTSVTGNVTVLNTNPAMDAELVSVQGFINDIEVDLDCPSLVVPDADYDVDSNIVYGTLVCPFTLVMPEGQTAMTVGARVEQQLYDYAADGTATLAGTRVYQGAIPVTQGGTGTETDECVQVSDIYLGTGTDLGEFCASASPITLQFTGTISVDAEDPCEFEVANLAQFVTNDSGTSGSDTTLVSVTRPDCGGEANGCTRTQGYWKTHSIYGPAPYDDTWAQIGEDTPFFSATASGGQLSWYGVLWTQPRGNAYFTLAHQYIAASLNLMSDASASQEVLDAMDAATTLFETYTSAQIGALKGNKAPRPQFLELAELLDRYNNGDPALGASHCDDGGEDD